MNKSGIFCRCECYRIGQKIRNESPCNKCMLLLPEEKYADHVKWSSERWKDPNYDFPYIVVLNPGVIRVRFTTGQKSYTNYRNLCDYQFRVGELLDEHLGEKIRLGRNLGVE